jgi:hypothetical protein
LFSVAVQLTLHRRTRIRRQPIIATHAVKFASLLILEAYPLIKRMLQRDRALNRAALNTHAAEPTLVGIEHNGRITFGVVRNQNAAAATLNTGITALAQI